jgi:UDP-glucose 4-epimerase
MLNILITGGAGFIGSHLVEELILEGNSVTVYDNLSTGKLNNLSNCSVNFIKGDILNYKSLSNAMRNCEVVFHLAALTSVVESLKNIENYVSINLNGTLNVLKAASENKIKMVIFASSAAVYGDSPDLPKIEEMRLNPKSPYAITKVDGEYYCNLYHEYYNLPTVCARFFNVFGERQDLNSSYAAAIPSFIFNCIKNHQVTIYGDGAQTRDFIYVKDLVKALILLMKGKGGIFNIGYGKAMDINTLVRLIKNYLNSSSEICYVSARPADIKHSFASINKLTSFGFIPEFSLEKGLYRTIDYFKALF